jgi:hypothetical protein
MKTGRDALKKNVFSLFLFLMISVIVLVLVKVVNWLPLTLQNETLRRYGSVEEIKAGLNIPRIYIPTYFPQTISWPPEHLFAQSKPFPWIMMKFNHRNSSREALIITQSRSDPFPDRMPGQLTKITEKAPYELRGRPTLLEVGTCSDGEPCSRISWREGEYRLTVFMTSAPFELIKITESMLH